jgi:putative addiction module component (TIGR02574 family)
MARNAEQLEKELLNLSHKERARLAHRLIVSLDEEAEHLSAAEWEALWLDEIHRRERDLREGKAKLRPAEDVLRDLRKEFSKK